MKAKPPCHGANMGPIWVRQDPGGPHVGPMNLVIWADYYEVDIEDDITLVLLNEYIQNTSLASGVPKLICPILMIVRKISGYV